MQAVSLVLPFSDQRQVNASALCFMQVSNWLNAAQIFVHTGCVRVCVRAASCVASSFIP